MIDFDWSNWKGKGAADGWAKKKPMDCEERLATQVKMTTEASPSTKVWVYRNSVSNALLSRVSTHLNRCAGLQDPRSALVHLSPSQAGGSR